MTKGVAVALNLNAPHVHQLAREPADPTADTMTGAVEVALREARMLMQARYGDAGVRDLDLLLQAAQATVVPVARDQVDVAIEGFRRSGRGRHVAGLNYGDLVAYGLASLRAEPLLLVGDDFAKIDVTPVARPPP